jgi:hypothetical protein
MPHGVQPPRARDLQRGNVVARSGSPASSINERCGCQLVLSRLIVACSESGNTASTFLRLPSPRVIGRFL